MQVLLLCLQALHILWTLLFLRILWRILFQTSQQAAQAEYEGESDESSDKDD